ncbi:MAG: type II secretion system protein [Akkermansiaceae bacterium]|nr:type II secretion system protein [Akkermansiaceae bacterium]
MKNPAHRHHSGKPSRSGFTLIELLVVIAIILVLAAAGFQAGRYVLQKAKKQKALAVCTQVEMAVNNFYQDTGTMPLDISGDQEINSNSPEGIELLEVLLNQETADPPRNTRGRKYLDVKEGKGSTDGIIYDNAGQVVEGLYDPWGGDYYIALDGDYDEKVEVQPQGAANARVLQRIVAVYSNGADADESDGGSVRDDVTTW